MSEKRYYITDFGAAEGTESNTIAIQKAIDAAHKNGGGEVVVPAGVFVTGALFLKDNLSLHLAPGAVLKFSDDQKDYPVVVSRWEGVQQKVYASCIYAENAENISVTGFGILDGSGSLWWDLFRNNRKDLAYPRPKLISFHQCRRITIRDIQLVNSPSWTVNPILCEDVTIDNLSILNPADSPNTDGIDPDSCKNVHISNCHIDVGDDCIAIKAGTEETAERISCENITIINCTMVHGHGGVVLGSEMSGDIRNVTISNCVFQGTDRGIRLKSRRGRGGIVEDIRISNIVMKDVVCPFIINLYYYWGPKGEQKLVWTKESQPVTKATPCFRRIHFMNITAENVQAAAGFIYGLAEQYAEGITFDNVRISMAEEAVEGEPAMMMGMKKMKNQGFLIQFAENVLFERVTIENHEGSAFQILESKEIELCHCRSKKLGETIFQAV
ncbi:glycoside hydrolase family 28 protein [Enterococcus sp. LJL128]